MSECTDDDFESAIGALCVHPTRFPAADWPSKQNDYRKPGLYSWWVDEKGAEALSEGLAPEGLDPKLRVAKGMVYAGQTGATIWPAGVRSTRTLAQRLGLHLEGRVGVSTFRHTLASILRIRLGLQIADRRKLEPASEITLREWIGAHISLAAFPFEERDRLGDLEKRVLKKLDPPFNLKGMKTSPVRRRLRELRRQV